VARTSTLRVRSGQQPPLLVLCSECCVAVSCLVWGPCSGGTHGGPPAPSAPHPRVAWGRPARAGLCGRQRQVRAWPHPHRPTWSCPLPPCSSWGTVVARAPRANCSALGCRPPGRCPHSPCNRFGDVRSGDVNGGGAPVAPSAHVASGPPSSTPDVGHALFFPVPVSLVAVGGCATQWGAPGPPNRPDSAL
jgi:hypothetical protein